LHFIVVDDAGAVTLGQVREARSRMHAELAVILERDAPRAIVRLGDLPPDADQNDRVAPYLDRMQRLRRVAGAGERLETVLFEPEYAVLMHRRTPFVVPASRPLRTVTDVVELFASPRLLAVGPDARLPGEPQPLPPARRTCYCPLGHQIENPAELICPQWDHLPLKC
jgi:hypothetical protein